jgi:hypothetical protein
MHFIEKIKKFLPIRLILAAKRTVISRLTKNFQFINPVWFLRVKYHNWMAPKNCIKIGIGPIITGEGTLGYRKWHIDPIINEINRRNGTYTADFFFSSKRLSRFDIVIFTKDFPGMTPESLASLQSRGIKIFYRLGDYPLECCKDTDRDTWFIRAVDGVIVSNPLQLADLKNKTKKVSLIHTTAINADRYKKFRHSKYSRKKIRIIWQGYRDNTHLTNFLDRIIAENIFELRVTRSIELELLYHTNLPSIKRGIVRYKKWNILQWKGELYRADIAVSVKPAEDDYQMRKPATKVISYMAAGLPVVCDPSAADELVIEHGRTGYFARTDEEWKKYLNILMSDPDLRQKVGTAAREFVAKNYNVKKITDAYLQFI